MADAHEVPASVREALAALAALAKPPGHAPGLPLGALHEVQQACFKARAYSACAVMCGRALEGICRHFETRSQYLGGGLKELRERSVIDGRLFEWAQALQNSRNLSAHATGQKVSKQDASDLLDFTKAICEYTFVVSSAAARSVGYRPCRVCHP